ncbi:xanthine permease [Methylocella silvestris BL2]|uniref:Xanthine permease n=1 Tax=Methylocella silvestris (strain DSM 15510 / CIP 108128 / LMG 27833 / NCIMB 13906 / BL2) TaxID=395965 RepID=B8EIL6_METSB|nr:nucleobase:cation symporter-2 family protein [Methylocella silvestris]ACK51833.1 xanthine permease [Methylocella silvestris BL2]
MAAVHPVDEVLPAPRLFALGLQHVLVMYANAVAVPLILGGALKLPKDQIAMLINADLFACGIATLVQTIGIGPFGIRLPVIMGVTAVSISPMLAMAAMPGVGLTGIYGAVIVGGLFGLAVTPFVKYVLPFFPAVVTGTIITMIGVVLMRVGVNWAGGGANAADFGAPGYLLVAALVLAVILIVIRFASGFLANAAVLIGVTVGYLTTIALGWTDFSGIHEEPWLRVVLPLQFGLPTFHLIPCLTMCLVMTIVFIEATGMFLALGAMTGREVGANDIKRGLRADALGTIIGGVFNTFPYVSYSQNIGLVAVTGVFSRWVCVTGGCIMLALGLIPKLAFIVASVPQCVLGGAGFIMFGMVAATGVKILKSIDYVAAPRSTLVIAISIGFGLIPIVSPNFFHIMPPELRPIFGDGIILTSIAAVSLNAIFNRTTREEATEDAVLAAQGASHI